MCLLINIIQDLVESNRNELGFHFRLLIIKNIKLSTIFIIDILNMRTVKFVFNSQ